MNNIKIFWKPVTWGVIVVLLSSVDTSDMSRPGIFNFRHFDKALHFTMYMVFTYLLAGDLIKSGLIGGSLYFNFFAAAVAAVIFGGAMELLQMIPELKRNASMSDFYANTAGAAAAVLMFRPLKLLGGAVSGSVKAG